MSNENTVSGIVGKFVVDNSLVARTTQWVVTPTLSTTSEWGDSDSGGYTNRLPGRKDATFTAEGNFESTDEVYDLFQEGDIVIAALWLDNSSLYYAFPRALCTEFSLTVNIDTGEVTGWTASFGADGIYYRPGEDGAPVYTLPS